VFWPDLASAHYAKDTLVRLEDLKLNYVQENPSNDPEMGELEKESLQQQSLSKRCKVLDGKDQKRAEVH
jgi:hypothetical protein